MARRNYPLIFMPGIQRDGTNFAGRSWIDGQWGRFKRGMPAKMLGYQNLNVEFPAIPRGTIIIPNNAFYGQYIGFSNTLQYYTFNNQQNITTPLTDRTPNNFVPNNNTLWSFDKFFYKDIQANVVIAHPGQNLANINSALDSPVYFGFLNSQDAFQPTGQQVSGGIVALSPYLFIFGNNGQLSWSADSDPTDFASIDKGAGSTIVTGQKIVAGMRIKGSQYYPGPSGLFWSLDSLIRATFTGNQNTWFRFDTISDEISILSSKSIIEDDSLYYWVGVDRFLYYDGQNWGELPNKTNLDFFFNSLNYEQRQKVWATKVPRFGEIWWFFPKDGALECNHAVIYNKRDKCWYDTPINRCCGQFEQTFAKPLWLDNQVNADNTYSAWVHETGVDQNYNGNLTALEAFHESGNIAWCALAPDAQWKGIDSQVLLTRIEPDLIQSQDLTLDIKGREFARSVVSENAGNNGDPYVIAEDTQFITTQEQQRELTLRFGSNVLGGYYEMGNTLLEIDTGDVRA